MPHHRLYQRFLVGVSVKTRFSLFLGSITAAFSDSAKNQVCAPRHGSMRGLGAETGPASFNTYIVDRFNLT